MSGKNPNNPRVVQPGSKGWVETSITQAQLATIRHDYHLYDSATYGLTPDSVLRMTGLDVTLENIENEVMVVFEVQLKCSLRIPPSPFLTRLFEVWG